MASVKELRVATLRIGREDTGAGSLVQLTGKTVPILRYGDRDWLDVPRIAARFPRAPKWRGVPRAWVVDAVFEIRVRPEQDGLEWDLAERLFQRLTNPRYAARGVDTTVQELERRDNSELDAGRVRLDAIYRFRMSA